jgi:hypothetical protein
VYQAPEIEHLQKAVDAVKRGLVPELKHTPEPEMDIEQDVSANEREDSRE